MASSGSNQVTVRGAGIFGLACAWECLSRGAEVLVIESHRIGAGASGGIVGALAPHVPENWNPKKAFQLESLIMARAFWSEVAAASGLDPGYVQGGRLQPLADLAAVARARVRAQAAATLWQGQAVWRVVPARDDGWAPASPGGWLVEDTLSARLHPRLAAAALVAAIRARGGVVQLGGAEPPAEVFANRRNLGPVIWATGVAGLADLSTDLGRPVGAGVKGQSALLRHDAGHLPQIFAEGVHIVPHSDATVAIGSTSERNYADATGTDAALERLLAAARGICPALAGAPVLERWAGLRPRANTRAPMLGGWPGRPGHFIANGGFKIGFGMAPKVAAVMAELVLAGHDTIPQGFRVDDNL